MKIATIVGARPQFIKAAPVSRAIRKYNQDQDNPQVTEVLVHTGQHYDYNMSQVFFDELKIQEPDYHLGVGSGTHGKMTGAMLEGIEQILLDERPRWVLVYGDTNSTLAGALAAAKLHIPVAHVEAGLRSFNRRMPEEINRVLTDHVSTLLFCPTETAVINLENEGITQGVHHVGDVMYDSFLVNRGFAEKTSVILSELGLKPGHYCLATVHRQENTEDSTKLLSLLSAFEELASADCPFVIPLHPRTLQLFQPRVSEHRLNPHIRIVPPVTYIDMIHLEVHARVILTDSGGVQKEAYFAQVPCITLRNETEWIETVEAGWNNLAGTDLQGILEGFRKTRNSLPKMKFSVFGEGEARYHILKELLKEP